MNNTKNYPPKIGDRLTSTLLGKTYIVGRPLNAKGGFVGSVFYCIEEKSKKQYVLKLPRVNGKELGAYALNERLLKVSRSFLSELYVAERLRDNPKLQSCVGLAVDTGSYAPLMHVSDDDERNVLVSFNVIEFIEGVDLSVWCREQSGVGNFYGITRSDVWFDMCRKIAEIVAAVHSERVVHGDIWEPNIMVKPDGNPVLIDFGKSWRQEDLQFHDGNEKKQWPYMAPELLSHTWTSQADIYSLGGVFYFLATGNPPPPSTKENSNGFELIDVKEFETILRSTLATRNPDLVSDNEGVFEVIWLCMHPMTEMRAPLVLSIIDLIDRFLIASRHDGGIAAASLSENLKKLASDARVPYVAARPVFSALAQRAVHKLARNISCAATRLYTVRGSGEEMRDAILLSLGTLHQEDTCRAILTIPFWIQDSIGSGTQIISMLRMIGRRGVRSDWLLIVSETESRNPIAHEIMERLETGTKESECLSMRFRIVSDTERFEMFSAPKSCIYLEQNDAPKNKTLITPYYSYPSQLLTMPHSDIGNLAFQSHPIALRFWAEPDRWKTELRSFFEHHWAKGQDTPANKQM
jgi:serine/threonine protein kinase